MAKVMKGGKSPAKAADAPLKKKMMGKGAGKKKGGKKAC